MKKNRRKKDKNLEPRFMFTKNEIVQLWDQQGRKGMLVASTRDGCGEVCRLDESARGEKLTIAEIGTVEGETIEAQFKCISRRRCRLYYVWFGSMATRLMFETLTSTDWTHSLRRLARHG